MNQKVEDARGTVHDLTTAIRTHSRQHHEVIHESWKRVQTQSGLNKPAQFHDEVLCVCGARTLRKQVKRDIALPGWIGRVHPVDNQNVLILSTPESVDVFFQ